ncbi:putative biotin transporter BioY [Simkania negevensis Z]|uniref:Putative biotin transporter BioY n=2 Tax=Simkania negevensis TaxID=83561 RepID=F8L632_SIMNZ|nr:putative biotin transporter BioY [Simkania negevensis Z]
MSYVEEAIYGGLTMNTKTETVAVRRTYPTLVWIFHVVLGGLFLAGCSQLEVLIGPVPVTLQTLAIFLLAFFQGGQKAALSTCLYLGAATVGLPVLSGWSVNPLWMIGPCGGYLVAFPIAAFLIGKLANYRKSSSYLWLLFSVLVGQVVIYLLGVSWLAIQIGFRLAIDVGLLPFLWPALLKTVCAASLKGGYVRWQRN